MRVLDDDSPYIYVCLLSLSFRQILRFDRFSTLLRRIGNAVEVLDITFRFEARQVPMRPVTPGYSWVGQ